MAVAYVAQRHGSNNGTVGTSESLTMAAGGSITVGNQLFLAMATDNSGSSGDGVNATISDPRGNIWFLMQDNPYDPGAANEGAQIQWWRTYVSYPYQNGDSITVDFDVTVVAGAFSVEEWSGIEHVSWLYSTGEGEGNGTSFTAANVTPQSAGDVVWYATSVETNDTITVDADVTDGTWVARSNELYNSGSDATSIQLFTMSKVVTGTSAQSAAATGPSARDYAAVVAIMREDPGVRASDGVRGNPNYACVAGYEGLPTADASVPVDTGTGYVYRHTILPDNSQTQDYTVDTTFAPLTSDSQHSVIYDLYRSGDDLIGDEVTTSFLPANFAFLVGGAAVVGGGTALDAITDPGGSYIQIPDGDRVDLRFDTTAFLAEHLGDRIVRIGVRYIAWKDDSSPSVPSEGIIPSWRQDGREEEISGFLVRNYRYQAQYETRWLGEMNPVPGGVGSDWEDGLRMPWSIGDLTAIDSGFGELKLSCAEGDDPSATDIFIDFVQLIVETTVDRRVATGGRFCANTAITGGDPFLYYFGSYPVILRDTQEANRQKVRIDPPLDMVCIIREALPPSAPDYWTNLTSASTTPYGSNTSIGPSLRLNGYETPRATLEEQPVIEKSVVSKGVAQPNATDFDQHFMDVTLFDRWTIGTHGPWSPGYQGPASKAAGTVYSGTNVDGYILVDGATEFTQAQVLLSTVEGAPTATLDDLVIDFQETPPTIDATITITPEEFAAAEELANGWKLIRKDLDTPFTPNPTDGQLFWEASSASFALPGNRWIIGGAGSSNYTGAPPYARNYNHEAPDQVDFDWCVLLLCDLDAPDVEIANVTDTLERPNCSATQIKYPCVNINNGSIYDRAVIDRSLDGGLTFETVAIVDGVTGSWCDYGVPWDLANISYRVTGYRDADRQGFVGSWVDWTEAPFSAPGAAFGISDNNLGIAMVYSPLDGDQLEVTWNPLNPNETLPLHCKDYQVALRPAEERGLEVSVNVLVDNLSVCDPTGQDESSPASSTILGQYGELLQPGRRSMSPAPYDMLRVLEQSCSLVLQLPGGHTRYVTMDLGGLTVRTVHGVYMAEITLTDSIVPESDPYEGEA